MLRFGCSIALLLILTSCAGRPRFERPICARMYDDCTDACSARCDTAGPVEMTQGPSALDDNEIVAADCAVCVKACERKGEQCEGEAPPVDP